jgi:hypothetical protein
MERDALRKREQGLDALLQKSPARFVEESIAIADAYGQMDRRSDKIGRRADVATILRRAAAASRFSLAQPVQAIELYRRAGALQDELFPQSAGLGFAENIADLQQFDLHDRAAAAATLRRARPFYQSHFQPKGEMAAWMTWKLQWLDAEVAYLETGKPFRGKVDAKPMMGFLGQIYFGAGGEAVGGVPLDPALNAYAPNALPPAELEKKVAALPASHDTFLRTWLFVTRFTTPKAVQQWLTRNDPGGYWSASLLTLAAVADRDLTPSDTSILATLVRTEEKKPTAIALLAREHAKQHPLPPKMRLAIGH